MCVTDEMINLRRGRDTREIGRGVKNVNKYSCMTKKEQGMTANKSLFLF